jgi:hypothetical protein
MTKATTETNKGKGNPLTKATTEPPAFPPFPMFDAESLRTLLDTQRAMLDGIVAVNRELLDFAETRMRADIETIDGLCRCKDWQQFAELQNKFFNTMTTQYFDRTTRLMTAASKMLAAKRAADGGGES